jgi:hypothetical protein
MPIYTSHFENVSVAAVQDLFMLKAAAGNPITLHNVELSAGGVTAAAELRVRLRRLPATVTNGSGGTAPTISAVASSTTKGATATLRANDTTQATTSGTAQILSSWQWNVLGPFQHLPTPPIQFEIQGGEALVCDLAAAPAASTPISGAIQWEEA